MVRRKVKLGDGSSRSCVVSEQEGARWTPKSRVPQDPLANPELLRLDKVTSTPPCTSFVAHTTRELKMRDGRMWGMTDDG